MTRFAMCNEAFGDRPFETVCREIRDAGYTGIEIAPFTLGASPAEISAGRRGELLGMMSDAGLTFAGLHWLMVSPPGLHVTTADAGLRERSWNHVRALIDLCGDLAAGPAVMVFGSPKQRGTTAGTTRAEAVARYTDGLAAIAKHAESRNVTLLVEALPANQCDVVQTLAEAAAIVNKIQSPAVQTMFDTHNAVDELESPAALIKHYFPMIWHVHVNELDGRYPGTGSYDFGAVLGALERLGYQGWVSVEVFDFQPDPVIIARESFHYLQSLL
jgi:sugar phosphate isomerase/epimerase